MEYEWKKTLAEGQEPIGYIEIYETIAKNDEKNINIRTIINYYPKLNEFSNNKICNVTIFYACEKKDITDSFFHWISDDICELISNQENTKYESGMNNFKTMFTQHFFGKKLPDMEYFTHGDYSKC